MTPEVSAGESVADILPHIQPSSGVIMQRPVTVLVGVLGLTISMVLPAATGAVLAKGPQLDVRGTWELTWRGVDAQTGKAWRLHATAVIRAEDLRTGAFTGDYDIPEQPISTGTYKAYHHGVSGNVRGQSARLVGLEGSAAALTVHLVTEGTTQTFRDGRPPVREEQLTLQGSWKGIKLDGTLVAPAPPQSLDGGDGASSTSVNCLPALGAEAASYLCLISVADDSGRRKVTEPSGQVAVAVAGHEDPPTCDLATQADGARGWCLLTVPESSVAAADGEGTAPHVTVEYAGDKHFGPSESSWFVPVPSGSTAPDAGAPDPVRQLIDLAQEVTAAEYQMLLDIARVLQP